MKLFLRVGVWRGGKLVDDRYLPETGDVTFGASAENTFGLLGTGLPETRQLVHFEGHHPVLHVTDGMTGEIALDGKVRESIEKLRAKGQSGKDGWTLQLPETARGWVALGGVTFFLQQSPKPPPPPKSTLPQAAKTGFLSGLESTFLAVFLAVMSVEGVGVFAINRRPYIEADGPVSREDVDRFVTVEEEKKPEEPKKEEKKAEAKKDEPKKEEKKAEKAEKPAPSTPQEAKQRAQEQGRQLALEMVGSIGQDGAFDQIIKGDSSQAADLANALTSVNAGITTASNTTLEGRGTSHGDGPTGIGDLNSTIGGNGNAKARQAAAQVTDKKIVAAPVEVENDLIDVPSTTFSSADLAKAVRSHMGSVKACYEKQLKLNPSLKGKIVMRFTITPAGRVSEVSAETDTMGSSDVTDCIARLIHTWSFSFKLDDEASVSFPFVFSSAN